MARVLFISLVLTALSLCATAVAAAENAASVKQIDVRSGWGGLGASQNTEISIRSRNRKYYIGRKSVDPALVEELVSALRQPTIAEPSLSNLGVTPQWLRENAIPAAMKASERFTDAAQNQKDLYLTSFNDPAVLQKVVTGLFHFARTDDYPFADIVVTFADGSSLSAESHSWYEFMLPWKLSGNAEATYNADISRAIAALLPKKATNRERLAGGHFDVAVSESVMSYIERQWKLLATENRLGGMLTDIRREYTVEDADINPYHHPEYGIEWSPKGPHETNLHATLHRAGAPSNYVVALVLRITDNRVEGVEQFLRGSERYQDVPFSIPWMADYIREHPRDLFRVSYVHNASFGDKAMRVFGDDMRAIGKDDLLEEAQKHQSELTLLITGMKYAESYWLVFPDRRVVLWRYGGPSGLLNWTPADLLTHRCSKYQGVVGGCVGATVSPEGVLEKTATGRAQDREK